MNRNIFVTQVYEKYITKTVFFLIFDQNCYAILNNCL